MHFWQSYFVPKFKIFLSVHYRRVHYACTVFGGDKVGSVHLKCLIKFLFFTFLRKVFCKVVEWFILFARITRSPSCSYTPYSIFSPTARATFPGRVHGVVVHASKYVPGSSMSSNFAVMAMSFTF